MSRKQIVETRLAANSSQPVSPSSAPREHSTALREQKADSQGRPLIERMSARIGDLEHRLDWLERKYDPGLRGDGQARILGEILALRAAIRVMRYHEAEVGGEFSVITALERLVVAGRAWSQAKGSAAALEVELDHAEAVLAEIA